MSAPLSEQQLAEMTERAEAWEGHVLGAWENRFPMAQGLDNAVLKLAREVKAATAEVERLRAQLAVVEAREKVIAEFVAERAEYITALRNCHPDNGHDYDRWQGHAAARRQLAEKLGLPVAWPAEGGAS